MKNGFDEFIGSVLDGADVSEFERNKKSKKIGTIIWVIGLIISILTFVFIVIMMMNDSFDPISSAIGINFLGTIVIIVGAIISIVCSGKNARIISRYKEKAVDFLLKGKTYTYEQKSFISRNNFTTSPFYTGETVDNYEGEDYLRINVPNDDGTASNNWFSVSDICAEHEYTDKDGDKHTQIIFSGVFGYIDFPFKFKHTLTINHRQIEKRKLERVRLEDIAFNNAFKVWCDDQIEARYILTPEVMAKLKQLKESFGNIQIVLSGHTLYFAAPYKNLFAISSRAKTLNATAFSRVKQDVDALSGFVSEIARNNKVFKI